MSDPIFSAIPDERGCGHREEDGIYAECGLSPFGSPVEAFLLDPPIPIPPDLQISPLGVTMIEWNGVYHLVDWVGAEHYPNVADYIEETRRLGLSRRLSPSVDFSKLTKESRILLVHGKAGIKNLDQYPARERPCPTGKHGPGEPCVSQLWEDLDGAVDAQGNVNRQMPSFSYTGKARPDNVPPDYQPMFFARFPISRLAVVNGQNAEQIADKIQKTGTPLPVQLAEK